MYNSKIGYLSFKLFLLSIVALTVNLFPASPKLEYILSMNKPYTHYYEVEMKISNLNKPGINIKMPVWAPGSYLVRDFEKNVENLEANNGNGNRLAIKKVDKNTWHISINNESIVDIRYKVYAFEKSVRTSYLDASHGFVVGSSVFMFIEGMKNLPSNLTVIPYKSWNEVSTGLDEIEGSGWQFRSPNYDILVDSPIEIGNHKVFHFNAAGVKYEIAMYGYGNYDMNKMLKDMKKIVETETSVVGVNPNKRYLFIIHNLDRGSGGLEHLNSCTLDVNRWIYKPKSSYMRFLGLVAHEHFHLWNVKRIRPIALGPFDYNKENYTSLLWEMEGVTTYYSTQTMLRSGFVNPDKYLNMLASGFITRIENQPGNKIQSAADASYDAWIKAYKPNENSYNTTVSYYTKGCIIGMLLDLEIIHNTKGENDYDDVLRYLYNEYYKKKGRGFTDKEYIEAVEKIAEEKLDEFFQNYVYGTKEIDYNKYLNYAGLKLVNQPDSNASPLLGINLKDSGGHLIVTSVVAGTPAYNSGINANDEVIAVNGFRVNKNIFDKIYSTSSPGDTLSILVSHNGIIKTRNVILDKNNRKNYKIVTVKNPSQEQKMVYNKWLHVKP